MSDTKPTLTRTQVAAAGGSQRFLTGLSGYTHFNLRNEGPGEQAEAFLTWVDGGNKPRVTHVVVHGIGSSEFTFHAFDGAKVTVTNQSQDAIVSVALSLG